MAFSMATTVLLFPDTTPGYTHVAGLRDESAKLTSKLLTINHASYHTRWKATFHNHIAHHLLALWALGATTGQIQEMWNYNQPYQTPIEKIEANASPAKNLRDPDVFKQCLGDNSCYANFLSFFEHEIDEKGIPATLQEYLLKGDDGANEIFCRMWSDLLHPVIHLGCGLEFQQPSIVAEALAGACVHETWPGTFLLPTEEFVRLNESRPGQSLLQIIEGLGKDPAIRNGVKHTDPFNKIADGLLTRVGPGQLAPYLSQFTLGLDPSPDDLQSKMIDLVYTCAYMLAGAQQPDKREAFDFITLHTATMCAFYPVILAQGWLSSADKARLLEGGARTSAVMYAACGDPELHSRRILDYVPRYPDHGWPELINRSIVYRDEGHAAKLVRALWCIEQLGEPAPGFPIAKADLIKIAHMGMDSIELAFDEANGNRLPAAAPEIMARVGYGGEMVVDNMTRWVYYGGLERAWDHIREVEGARS